MAVKYGNYSEEYGINEHILQKQKKNAKRKQ
jgi:hypothetical protein